VESNGGNIDVFGSSGIVATNIDAGTGIVTLTTNGQEISQSESGPDITASDVIVNGDLSPGGRPTAGQMIIDGDVTFSSGDAMSVDLNGLVAGTDHDQLQILGPGRVIDLGGATFSAALQFAPSPGDQCVLRGSRNSRQTFVVVEVSRLRSLPKATVKRRIMLQEVRGARS
jgi:hypothetical protein